MGILVMTSWKNDYIAALKERDKKEKANQKLYNYCIRISYGDVISYLLMYS